MGCSSRPKGKCTEEERTTSDLVGDGCRSRGLSLERTRYLTQQINAAGVRSKERGLTQNFRRDCGHFKPHQHRSVPNVGRFGDFTDGEVPRRTKEKKGPMN